MHASLPRFVLVAPCLAAAISPHGSQYTPPPPPVYAGPGDLGAGSVTRPGSPAPSAPATGSPGTPSTPLGSPLAPANGAPGSPGTPAGCDFDASSWELWWHYNSAAYLEPRRKLRSARPATDGGDEFFSRERAEPGNDSLEAPEFLPLLQQLSREDTEGPIRASTALALGKLARVEAAAAEAADAELRRLIAARRNEVSESAAVAIGIASREAAAPLLEALVLGDAARLRAAEGLDFGVGVPERTRAFAACALAVSCERLGGYWRLRAADVLGRVASGSDATAATTDLRAACTFALGLLELPFSGSDGDLAPASRSAAIATRADQVRRLLALAADEREPLIVRAQAPVSAARAVDGAPRADPVRRAVAARLVSIADPDRREPAALRASAVLALGSLGLHGDSDLDRECARVLIRVARGDADLQARAFAAIALGSLRASADREIEGTVRVSLECTAELARQLSRAPAALRAYAALGLGIGERGIARSGRAAPSSDVALALRMAFDEARSPGEIGALAIALGLAGDAPSGPLLLARVGDLDARTRGYVAVALGMLSADGARLRLAELAEGARFDPILLAQVGIAIGLVGDAAAEAQLVEWLSRSESATAQAGLSRALGRIGGPLAARALARIAGDASRPVVVRDYAVVALGRIVEDSDTPWNAKLAVGANYALAPAALASPISGDGVLDIL
jgi:hypothetical protein